MAVRLLCSTQSPGDVPTSQDRLLSREKTQSHRGAGHACKGYPWEMNRRAQGFPLFFLNQLQHQLQHTGYRLGETSCSSSKEIVKYISAFLSTFVWTQIIHQRRLLIKLPLGGNLSAADLNQGGRQERQDEEIITRFKHRPSLISSINKHVHLNMTFPYTPTVIT